MSSLSEHDPDALMLSIQRLGLALRRRRELNLDTTLAEKTLALAKRRLCQARHALRKSALALSPQRI